MTAGATVSRAALVTGGSRGIGLAIAQLLAGEGYALTLVSRRAERLEAVAAQFAIRGVDCQAVVADLQHEDQITAAVAAHERRFGRLDVLVNNAGFGIAAPIGDLSTSTIDRMLAVDLRSTILVYRAAMAMLESAGVEGGALVVNVASITGKVGTELLSVYSAAKHGIVGFTQAMNRELAAKGIKSCAICPGYVDTDLAEFKKSEIPGAEMIRPEDVAEMVRALLRLSRWAVVPEIVIQRPGDEAVA
ncbi:MAG: SDR family oxidoreductase [Acidimicrobiales bacterium]